MNPLQILPVQPPLKDVKAFYCQFCTFRGIAVGTLKNYANHPVCPNCGKSAWRVFEDAIPCGGCGSPRSPKETDSCKCGVFPKRGRRAKCANCGVRVQAILYNPTGRYFCKECLKIPAARRNKTPELTKNYCYGNCCKGAPMAEYGLFTQMTEQTFASPKVPKKKPLSQQVSYSTSGLSGYTNWYTPNPDSEGG